MKRHTIIWLAIPVILLTQGYAHASDAWLDIHLTSLHTQQSYGVIGNKTNPIIYKEMNKNNFGLGLSLPINNYIDTRIGFYDNSFNKTSVYLGAGIHTHINNIITAGILIGGASGYDNTPLKTNKISPTIIPQLSFIIDNVRAEIGYFPGSLVGGESAITLTIGIRL